MWDATAFCLRLEEASGARADSGPHGIDFTAVNNPVSTPGIQGDGIALVKASLQHLQASHARLDLGANGAFTLCGWALQNTSSMGDSSAWICRWSSGKIYITGNLNSGGQSGWWFLTLQGGVNKFVHFTGCPLVESEWYFWVMALDGLGGLRARVLSEASGGVDRSSSRSDLAPGGIDSSPSDTVRIGSQSGGAGNFDGKMDELWALDGYAFTTDDDEWMYNGGSGQPFAAVQARTWR